MLEFGEQLREVQRRAGLAPTPIPRLAGGRSGGVGTFARPPESNGSGQGWSGGPATGSVNTSGPSVVSGPGAAAARPADDTSSVDANATIARQVVARSAPELRTGGMSDALDADRRRRSRRILSVGVAVVAVVAVVAGVALFGGEGDDDDTLATSSVPSTTVPPDDFFAVLRPPAELIVAPAAAGGGFTVSYEMPESATEVEVQVVSGGPAGETFDRNRRADRIPSTEATMCVVARAVNDSGQISDRRRPRLLRARRPAAQYVAGGLLAVVSRRILPGTPDDVHVHRVLDEEPVPSLQAYLDGGGGVALQLAARSEPAALIATVGDAGSARSWRRRVPDRGQVGHRRPQPLRGAAHRRGRERCRG